MLVTIIARTGSFDRHQIVLDAVFTRDDDMSLSLVEPAGNHLAGMVGTARVDIAAGLD